MRAGFVDMGYGDQGVFRTTRRFDIGLDREGIFGSGSNETMGLMVDENGRTILAVDQRQQTSRTTCIYYGTMYLVLNDQGQLDTAFDEDGAAGVDFRASNAFAYDSSGGVITTNLNAFETFQYRYLVG